MKIEIFRAQTDLLELIFAQTDLLETEPSLKTNLLAKQAQNNER